MEEILNLQKINYESQFNGDMQSLIDPRTSIVLTWSAYSNHC